MSEASIATILQGPVAQVALDRLGVPQESLVRAVLAAHMERLNTSSLEPSTSAGFKAWATGFGVLANELIGHGFEKVETNNLPRMVNVDTAIAVALVSGDSATGLKSQEPRSRSARGTQSKLLVHSNEKQLRIDFPNDDYRPPLPATEEQITWWLMIYSDGDLVRAELSLPVGVGEDSRLAMWKTRIVLDVPTDGVELYRRDDDGGEPPLEIDVPVKLKG